MGFYFGSRDENWTRDLRLMSPAYDANANDITKVYERVFVRFRQHLIGAIAVNSSRQIID